MSLVTYRMLNKLVISSPVTQSREAVEQLIAYFNHGQQPEEMPAFYRLSGDMALVQSNKGDTYYITTPNTCSCPSAMFNPGRQCKHSKKYFPQTAKPETMPQGDIRATLPGWPGGMNGPVEVI